MPFSIGELEELKRVLKERGGQREIKEAIIDGTQVAEVVTAEALKRQRKKP